MTAMIKNPRIILASGSAARKAMLHNTGIKFDTIPSDIDEAGIIADSTKNNTCISEITEALAIKKALHVSTLHPTNLIIGSDQTLELEGAILSKAKDKAEAAEKLKALRGKTHILRSSVCIVQNAKTLFSHTESAQLTMHDFNDNFLDAYMQADADALTACVGAYKIEGAGAWLFSSIQGDNFTIMGMPLLPLLTFLRTEYGVLS